MTEHTLYLLVTCAFERTRFDSMTDVVTSLNAHPTFEKFNDTLLVFDNASTYPGARDLLSPFKHVVIADRNVGYWTAIDWSLRHFREIFGQKKYLYVIESDCVHHDMHEIATCEKFLELEADVGTVRTQEFSVADAALYDKDCPVRGSRRYAWQRQTNAITGERAWFRHAHEHMYRTNLLSVMCGLSRIGAVERALDKLRDESQLSELMYQKIIHEEYPVNAIYDGGLFDAKKAFDAGGISGSWNVGHVGYRPTRVDKIETPETYTVESVK